MPNSGSGWTGLSRSPQSSSKSSLQRPRPWGIPFRVDVAQLQAHASTFLWQKAMPGMIANSEHQHVAEFGRELESVISAIAAAQNPEPTSLIGPLAAEPEQHSDDLMLRIGVGVTFVVMARGITHHHDTRRVGGEIHVEFLLDQSPETLGEEVFDDRPESRSIPKTGQAVTAAIGDFRCIGEDLVLEPRAECLLDVCEVIGVAAQLCRGNGRLVQHRKRRIAL